MKITRYFVLGLVILGGLVFSGTLRAAPLSLNDFSFIDGDPVAIETDGSSAVISEDSSFASVGLFNDPNPLFGGDPEIIIASAGTSLLFEYDFMELGLGADDEFTAFLFDSDTGDILDTFFADTTSLGTVEFDLSSLVGTTLGMEFQLNSFDLSFDSMVTISDVRLETALDNAVPEPATVALMGIGIVGLAGAGYRKRKKGNAVKKC